MFQFQCLKFSVQKFLETFFLKVVANVTKSQKLKFANFLVDQVETLSAALYGSLRRTISVKNKQIKRFRTHLKPLKFEKFER